MTLIEYDSAQEVAAAGPDGGWRTSTRCVPNGNCVEINRERSDHVDVRDSKHPAAALRFRSATWTRFLDRCEG